MKFKDLLTPLNIVVVTIILILVVLIYKQREGFQSADENAKRKEAALRLAEEARRQAEAEEKARREAEEEAKRKAEEEAKRKAEEEAKRQPTQQCKNNCDTELQACKYGQGLIPVSDPSYKSDLYCNDQYANCITTCGFSDFDI
jgi:predicted Holliday junction resolvase-like endonuclease